MGPQPERSIQKSLYSTPCSGNVVILLVKFFVAIFSLYGTFSSGGSDRFKKHPSVSAARSTSQGMLLSFRCMGHC